MSNKTLENALNELLRPKNEMVELVILHSNLDYDVKERLRYFAKLYTNTAKFISTVKEEYWNDKEGILEFLDKLYKVFYALHGENAVIQ